MKRILFLLALIFSFAVTAQKNIYESPSFDDLSSDHDVLAIIPFLTNLDLNEKVSKSEQKRLEENEGYAVQNALETYFSKRSKKKKLPVTFQNIENTAAILAKEQISYDNIDVYTTKELSEILGVDGIISGTLDLNILLSNGVPTEFSFTDYFSGGANYGRIGIKISDGNSGKLLWKYEKEINKKTGKNTTDLIDRMMKLAIRKFPYERERKRDRKN
ncbi:hypothetical protein [Maribacter ulvicola]|uniref:DUF4136 domain-containing protein n=1 Tax=Maribacter ulvicola TaxID=228959 RepID=A0A1N6VVL0_9FLAO|nr:hypothetical protein [Maribacter ulvicola]SIQ81881.1 hypothetical protein SAMN05421797_103271 [Maribacter ulvicola]